MNYVTRFEKHCLGVNFKCGNDQQIINDRLVAFHEKAKNVKDTLMLAVILNLSAFPAKIEEINKSFRAMETWQDRRALEHQSSGHVELSRIV